ncbi:aspartyl-phosphate phosphatase Spo0E family protein [Paenibacillus sp. P26]|nr:aspartyl-phosphate phosphatase Spo0E family protein [Paenibacillus sp. P26]UUZ95519.1 aspartyl-phosphate phosphatase Spo0E family protein [Paenibacillus sp. P25]
MTDTKLLQKIEDMRLEMSDQFQAHEQLTHESVVAVSQRLDDYIIQYYKQSGKKCRDLLVANGY